ncbi:hypothetical protein [Salinispora vitiensis]|uniref:hypothetical protein n=1 Tax=Salinispora vitiensis TaxID=999544 RepID=UPI000476AF96|nr:hypothetical protein [Salinispora vitiensis]
MNHQDHTPGPEPVRPDQGRARARWRWTVGLAGVTGLALTTVGVAAPAAEAAGRPLASANEQPAADDRRSGDEPGKGKSDKGKSDKGRKAEKPEGIPVPCDADKLIAAITLANARGGAVLDLAEKCTYTLTTNIDGAGLPAITTPITLNGGKHTTITRAAAVEEFRIFAVDAGGDLTLNHLEVTGGQADGDGGGVLVNTGGALTVMKSAVTRNIASSRGGGIANDGITTTKHSTIGRNIAESVGGGIDNDGLLTVEKTSVTANTVNNAAGSGGGIGGSPGSTTLVTGSTVSGNRTGDAGGGVGSFNATVTLTDSTITNNTGSNGGGVFAEGGMLTVRRVTATDNTAALQGGGLSIQALTETAAVTVEDSKIAGNVAPGANGGGIVNSALAFDSTVVVRNTLITANQSVSGGGIFNIGVGGMATVNLFNTKIVKNIATGNGGGILNVAGTVNLNPATGTVVIKNRPNNCVNVPGCAG